MKVSVNAILTTIMGGNPVTTDTSKKAMEKLLDENTSLNYNLPQVVAKDYSKEQLIEMNVRAKTEKIYELLPELEKQMGEELVVAKASLEKELGKGQGMNKQYIRICEMIIADAENALGLDNKKSKLVDLKIDNEFSMR